ncbi:MAG: N-acetyltransferase family protein [Myxococcota bacterium]
MDPNIEIRPARYDDLDALNGIYNHYVVETSITFDVEPISVERRRSWFEQFSEKGRHRLLVCTRGGKVVGYTASMRFRPKPAYETSVETTVYLDPTAKGQGLGTRLYVALFEALAGEDLHGAYAGVTCPNPASVALHRRFGFRSIGLYQEVGRKFGKYWDVEWFEKHLGEARSG